MGEKFAPMCTKWFVPKVCLLFRTPLLKELNYFADKKVSTCGQGFNLCPNEVKSSKKISKFQRSVKMFTKIVYCFMSFVLVFAVTTNSVAVTGDSQNVALIGRALAEGPVHAVALEGNYAYICAGCAFVILDVSDPTQPVKMGSLVLTDFANDVYISENYAYVADSSSGLRIIDISDKQNPNEAGSYDTPGNAKSVFVSGNYAYVADGFHGLRVVYISCPTSPSEVDFYDTSGVA